MSQHMDALALGNTVRLARARLRHDIRAGSVDWRDVISDPPVCLGDMLLSEVLLDIVPGVRRVSVETLGRRAFNDGLTLTVRARRASLRTRMWVVEQAGPLVAAGLSRAGSGRRARPHDGARRKGKSKAVLLS